MNTKPRRSKKPCLLINEIFLGRTLMIHLSRWRTGEQGTQRRNTEQSARAGLSKGYEPERRAACGYSNTASQWGEKQTKWKSNWNFKVPRTYAPVLLTLIWYSDKLLFEIQWNAPQDKNEKKEEQESEKERELRWSRSQTLVCLWHLGSFYDVACVLV